MKLLTVRARSTSSLLLTASMIGSITVSLAGLTAAGCAAPATAVGNEGAEDDGDDAEGTSSAASERFSGEYSVPVDPSLAHAASSPVRVRWKALGGERYRLKYNLPTVLAGVNKRVDLEGAREADGTVVMSGSAGTARCTDSAGEIRCDETLEGIEVDLVQVRAALDARAITAAERAARFAVAEQFARDPLGILTVRRTSY